MVAYKGFNRDLTCTRGNGRFQYKVGKTYTEAEAKSRNNGFHCVEEPIEVLSWYNHPTSRYCIVTAGGDINEDGENVLSCTEMTILKEITLQQVGALECQWMMEHPEREYSRNVCRESGFAGEGEIVIVRGKHPKASGGMGATIFLLKESKDSKEIIEAGAYVIDGERYIPDVEYRTDGRQCR